MGCQCRKQAPDSNEITKENKSPLTAQVKEEVLKDNLNGNANSMIDTVKSGAIKTEEKPIEKKSDQISNSEKASSAKEKLDFNTVVLELINEVRANPSAYADTIENAKKNITTEKDKLIYKQKVKVSLTRGEEAFTEAAEKLRGMQPLHPFVLNQEIIVSPPENDVGIKDGKYLNTQVAEIKKTYKIDNYFKDMVKDAKVAVLLLIVDDNKVPGKKRDAILSSEYVNIGISSTIIGKTFAAYYTFSK